MLKVKFMQYQNVVLVEILEQTMRDSERLNTNFFRGSNGFVLDSEDYPEIINETKMYLKGKSTNNNITCCDFETEELAEDFINRASLAIKEYNESYGKEENDEGEAFYFKTTIVE